MARKTTACAVLLAASSSAFLAKSVRAPTIATRRAPTTAAAARSDDDMDMDEQVERLTRTFVHGAADGIREAYATEAGDCAAGEECDVTSLDEEDGWAVLRRLAWREEQYDQFLQDKAESDAVRAGLDRLVVDDDAPPPSDVNDVDAFREGLERAFASGDACVTLAEIDADEMLWD